MNTQAYNRNVRNACFAMGHAVPQNYTTAIATNGEFVVYNGMAEIVGRLSDFEPF